MGYVMLGVTRFTTMVFIFQVSDQNAFNMNDMEAQLRQLEGQYSDSDEECDEDSEACEDEDENNADNIEEEADMGHEDSELDDLYCVACDKMFRTVGAKENHETSRKHKDNMDKLIKEMQEEESELKSNSPHGDSERESEILEMKNTKKKKRGKKKNKTILQESDVENSEVENVPTLGEDSEIISNVDAGDMIPSDEENPGKLSTPPNMQEEEGEEDNIVQLEAPSSDDDAFRTGKKSKGKKKKPKKSVKSSSTEKQQTIEPVTEVATEVEINENKDKDLDDFEDDSKSKKKNKKSKKGTSHEPANVESLARGDLLCAQCR